MLRECICVGKQVISGNGANGPYRFTVGHFECSDDRVEGRSVFSAAIPPELVDCLAVGETCYVSLHYEVPKKLVKQPRVDYIAF